MAIQMLVYKKELDDSHEVSGFPLYYFCLYNPGEPNLFMMCTGHLDMCTFHVAYKVFSKPSLRVPTTELHYTSKWWVLFQYVFARTSAIPRAL